MKKETEQDKIDKKLKELPMKSTEPLFMIKNFNLNNNFIFNLSQTEKAYEKHQFNSIIREINAISFEKEIAICDLKKISNLVLFILIMDDNIIIINKEHIVRLKQFFNNTFINPLQTNNQAKLYFLTEKAKEEFKLLFPQCNSFYSNLFTSDEISQFERNLFFSTGKENEVFISFIKTSICNFILLKSYKLTQTSKYANISNNNYNIKDFISIKNVGTSTKLCLNVHDNFLYILKHFFQDNYISQHRYNHELEFYTKIGNKHPFISKYFGTFKNRNELYIVLEYIEGKTLEIFAKKNLNLTFGEKIKIIFEIILSIEYIHSKQIMIRDLKWDNIIINSNHDAILIDFDFSNVIEEEINMSGDVGSCIFSAPEQIIGNDYTYKADLYSLGMLINLILCEQIINGKDFLQDLENEMPKFPGKYLCLTDIYKDLFEDPSKRPDISTLANNFYGSILIYIDEKIINDDIDMIMENFKKLDKIRIDYLNEIANNWSNEKSSFIDISEIYHYLGTINYSNDIEKALYYFNLSADLNNSKTQFSIGVHYLSCKNMQKGLFYLNLSADQNNAKALFKLGNLYFEGILVKKDLEKAENYFFRCGKIKSNKYLELLGYHYCNSHYQLDINKSIYYLKLASKLHNQRAQSSLGYLYFQGEYFKKDLDMGIHYFMLAANQNNPESVLFCSMLFNNPRIQNCLAILYYNNKFTKGYLQKAIQYFESSAKNNDSFALFSLGKIYTEEESIRNINKAIYYLESASKNNYPIAQYFLGINYLNGEYFPQNISKGINYLTLSAKDNFYTQFLLGLEYLSGDYIKKDINKAYNYFMMSANQNYKCAQYCIGYMHQYTLTPKDIYKAIHYYNLASKQNYMPSQYSLGLIYLFEESVKNVNEGIRLLTNLADRNFPNAQYTLGMLYLEGEIIPKNFNIAIYNLSLSTHSSAYYVLGILYLEGKQIPKNIDKAIKYFKLSANKQNKQAQYQLFKIYYTNEYNSQNINKSIFYLQLSAKQGFPNAHFSLGNLYYEGKYIPKNISKAIYHFKEASNKNNHFAKNNLGVICMDGSEVGNAVVYFNEAIKQSNDILSMFNLSRIYYFGIGYERNVEKAIQLLEQAFEQNHFFSSLFLYLIFQFDDNFNNFNEANKYVEIITKEGGIDYSKIFTTKEKGYRALDIIKNFSFKYSNKEEMNSLQEFVMNILDVSDIFKQLMFLGQPESKKFSNCSYRKVNINNEFYLGFKY